MPRELEHVSNKVIIGKCFQCDSAVEMRRCFCLTGLTMIFKYSLLMCILMLFCFSVSAKATAIEGVVVTERGPLDGAVVKAYQSMQDALSDKNSIVSTTGKKPGFFRFVLPAGTYFFIASGSAEEKNFFAFHGANPVKIEEDPIWLPFIAFPLTAQIKTSSETSKIVGKVIYKGKPISEAQVSLYSQSGKNIRGLGLETKSTNNNGEFRFTPPPGSYVLVARKRNGGNGKMPLTRGDLFCFYGANPLIVEERREINIDINCHPKDDLQDFIAPNAKVKRSRSELARFRERKLIEPQMTISGRVLDRAGKPVKDIQVTAYLHDPSETFQMNHLRLDSENMTQTDAEGRYHLPVNKAGSYYLVARQHSGESPLKGEFYGLYEANTDHAVTINQGTVTADITVGKVMGDPPRREPAIGLITSNDTVITAPAVIERDTIWSGEVVAEAPVLVSRAATLTIAPGTVIRFKRVDRDGDGVGDGELRVLGRIIARGTSEKPIRFMSAQQKPQPGDWSYLLLFTSGEESVIEHTIFEDAFTGLQAHFSRAVIRDSVFRNNREGIRFGRAELDIEHNEIKNNDIGIRYHRLEGPVAIHGNIIKGNGVGLFLVPSSQQFVDFSADTYTPDPRYYMMPSIADNIITDNIKYNYQLGVRLSTDMPIGKNWWGTTDVALIRPTLFDRERDPELGSVTILPILSAPVQGAGPRR